MSSIQQNIQQNQEDFTLNLNSQLEIFKKGFFTNVLDLP